MSYYTAAGEPPGQWAGKGAAALGLTGQVDPAVIGRLYQHNIGPAGSSWSSAASPEAADEREEAAVAAYRAAHPYASATELAEVRAAERGQDPHQVPYFDLTVSAVKSVSVLHASYRVSARQARERGEDDQAAALDARADEIEDALMDSAREAVAGWNAMPPTPAPGTIRPGRGSGGTATAWSPACSCITISRDGDPQLHVHVAIWNRVQRADGADGNGGPWTPAACTTSGSPSPRSTDRIAGDQAVRAWAMSWCRGPTATAPRSTGSPRT